MSPEELKRQRLKRGWSQSDLAREMRRVATRELPSMDSLVRQIKRWESGAHEPASYRDVLDDAFTNGLVIDTELLERLARSDLTTKQLDDTRAAIDGLCVSYTTSTPTQLLDDAWVWLHRLDQARSGRLSIAQHEEILELIGWTALLAGNLAYDLNQPDTSNKARRIGLNAGQEIGHGRLTSWGHELAAWFQLGAGNYTAVIERAKAGQQTSGQTDVGAHITRHEAEAWAELGDRANALAALERAAIITENAPPPDMPGHHFQKDKDQQEKVAMSVAMTLGDTDTAINLAEAIERQFTDADGELLRPMRIAKARAVKATAHARNGDLDAAADIGASIFDIERQGIPEILRQTAELDDLLAEFDRADEFRGLRSALSCRSQGRPD